LISSLVYECCVLQRVERFKDLSPSCFCRNGIPRVDLVGGGNPIGVVQIRTEMDLKLLDVNLELHLVF